MIDQWREHSQLSSTTCGFVVIVEPRRGQGILSNFDKLRTNGDDRRPTKTLIWGQYLERYAVRFHFRNHN